LLCTVRLIQLSAFGACSAAGAAFACGALTDGLATVFGVETCGFVGARGTGFLVAAGGGLAAGGGFLGAATDLVCGFTGGGAGFLAAPACLCIKHNRQSLIYWSAHRRKKCMWIKLLRLLTA
jgi:hypothetical protein